MEVDQIVVDYMDHEMAVDDQEGCTTPKRDECRIQVLLAPPPPPSRKKRFAVARKKRHQPKNGYFHPPDLETFFAIAPRPACKLLHA